MFTGIIEEIGQIERIQHGSHSAVLHIRARTVLSDAKVGDSIAVNGVCLTVTSLGTNGTQKFTADVMHETLNRTSLAALKPGSPVNLERAMAAGGRFGGHIVSGHVDGVGTIQSVKRDDNAVWYAIEAAPAVMRYIVEKGSITIDGISLTVAKAEPEGFSISAIPHTVAVTTLGTKKAGDTVNLETDIIGKYVEKLLWGGSPEGSSSLPEDETFRQAAARNTPVGSALTKEFLARHGFS